MATDPNSNTPAGFQRFERRSRRSASPAISIHRAGTMGANAAAVELIGQQAPCPEVGEVALWVELFYDKSAGIVAVRAAQGANAYRVSVGKSGAGTIGAGAFCRYFEIPHAETVRYPALEFEGGYVGFHLRLSAEVAS